ncbi:BQ5605_C018g08661 [Microbotryum silenes-dioicae]|uniref:BQ5605_C018g08661 protein n=1 Tax=Microbotryum silenes-dioicae TaxID=796604 RepID=A0A2X0NUI1_9BASI|nr:BQ5605_C018g08661 [Microbotryum silenes-dioicae]
MTMVSHLHYEFGNYIGADLDSGSESGSDAAPLHDDDEHLPPHSTEATTSAPLKPYDEDEHEPLPAMEVDDIPSSNAVILHDDKTYYPSASAIYGEGVETMVQEEDAQPLSKPIIEPIKIRNFRAGTTEGPERRWDDDFMLMLASNADMIRNVAVVGHLHHGKTSLIDMLVTESHKIDIEADRPLRFTDTHSLAEARNISIKSSPVSLVLPNSRGKHYLVNLIDTPGHVNFIDEVASGIRIADAAVVVVDAVEGVMLTTTTAVQHLVAAGVPITCVVRVQIKVDLLTERKLTHPKTGLHSLVVNKVDRLILELRLPPADAYFKLKQTIEEVNTVISEINPDPKLRVSPELGNVSFASAQMGWCFTLKSFAKLYADTYGPFASKSTAREESFDPSRPPQIPFDMDQFAARLWGNIYFDPETRKFHRQAGRGESRRAFEYFILEPLYKLYSQVLGEDVETLKATLKGLGIVLKEAVYKMDVRPLLRMVMSQFFGKSTGLVDMLVDHVPSPIEGARLKVETTYTGSIESTLAKAMLTCDPKGPLAIQIVKLYPTPDASEFRAFGRIMSGTVTSGMEVKVLGEGYSPEDEEDMVTQKVSGVYVCESRYDIPVDGLPAGNFVLLSGVDHSITKTATLVEADSNDDEVRIFAPIKHLTQSVLKIAVEPMVPSELPKMLDGLRKINKTYPLIETRVEESGEHILLGTGELYLDCVMHDLRKIFAEIDIKVSDPLVKFCETVVETSALKCYADTPNKKNKITMIAEPLEKGIAEDIESGRVSIRMPPKQLGAHFQKEYGWDLLASRSIWAFGPDEQGPNILMDDTLPSDVDKKLLYSVKESIKQGFQWGCREGPLCDEPIRNVKFRLLGADLAQEPIYRGGGQIIPSARRVCYSSFLMATPRLQEPVYFVEIQAPQDCVPAIYEVLARRRGHVTKDLPKPGSPLYTVQAYIPVVDANGFETDLRTHTLGQAFCLQTFDHWSVCPGDPLDKTIVLRPLEPAPPQHLARDFVLKTRRRKGLNDQISLTKYLENEMVVALSASGVLDPLLL